MSQKAILNNLVSSLATKIAVAFLKFIFLILTARYLGVQSRGEISIFLLNIAVMQIINEVFTGYSLLHFIPRFNLKQIFRFGIIATLVFCSFCSLVFVWLNKQVPGYELSGWFVAILVVIHTFNCVILLGREQVRYYNLLSVLQPLLLTVCLCACLFMFHIFTFKAFFVSLLFSFCSVFSLSLFLVYKIISTGENKPLVSLKPLLINGLLLQSAALMYMFANRYSFYLLPDTAGVGLYSSASSLMEAVLLIAGSIAPVLSARVANSTDDKYNSGLTLFLIKLSFVSSLVVIGLIALIPESVLIWVLGKGFTGIRTLMILYAPAVLMASIFVPLSSYFSATGKQKKILPFYVAGFLVTVLIAPSMISHYRLEGAAYTAVFSYTVIAAGILFIFIREHKFTLRQFLIVKSDLSFFRDLLSGQASVTER